MCSCGCVDRIPMENLNARNAAASSAIPVRGFPTKCAGVARPAALISPSPRALCSSRTSCHCEAICWQLPLSATRLRARACSPSAANSICNTKLPWSWLIMREAMAASMKGARIGGPGVTAEIDGAYLGGCVPAEPLHCRRSTIASLAARPCLPMKPSWSPLHASFAVQRKVQTALPTGHAR